MTSKTSNLPQIRPGLVKIVKLQEPPQEEIEALMNYLGFPKENEISTTTIYNRFFLDY